MEVKFYETKFSQLCVTRFTFKNPYNFKNYFLYISAKTHLILTHHHQKKTTDHYKHFTQGKRIIKKLIGAVV